MPLQPGARLGPYEIVAPLGAGGMGEVYRARDTRLGRSVAIKVISSAFAADPRLRSRLEREAKAVAALNHPHICTLHDVGSEAGMDYLVLEHCEGETLATRLAASGPLPLGEVREYAIQMADALRRAHRHGITHRDLKPANVMITKSGVKILDFGLARESGSQSPDEPTIEQHLTEEGVVVGTVQYMAPEVLNGLRADARSDLFAFGLIVYEMLTGARPFAASSKGRVIAAILEREPRPLSELRPDTPVALQRLVGACLAKDPDERIQSAHDALLLLRWETDQPGQERRGRRSVWTHVAVGAIAALAGAAVMFMTAPPRNEHQVSSGVSRLAIALPLTAPVTTGINNPLAVSPDGKRIVYVGPNRALYLRTLDGSGPTALAGTEGSNGPFFSPDGNWVGFQSGKKLKKVSLAGARPVVICEDVTVRGAVWGAEDVITFAHSDIGLMRVPAAGGRPQPVAGTARLRWPFLLPNGRDLLLTRYDGSGDAERNEIVLFTADGQIKPVLRSATHGQYASSGHLVFLRGGSLYRVPFDVRAHKIAGSAQPIVNDVQWNPPQGLAYASVVGRTVFYLPLDPRFFERELLWIDRRGRVTAVTAAAKQGYGLGGGSPLLSPDGREVVVDICTREEGCDIWRFEVERATWNRVTSDGRSGWAVWSRDGRVIAYASNSKGPYNVFVMPSDGSGEPRRLTSVDTWAFPYSFSPDGKVLAIHDGSPAGSGDLWLLDLASGKRTPYVTSPGPDTGAVFSPDGRWIAYASAQSGKSEVYVRPADGKAAAKRISTEGGVEPRWRADGRELFFSGTTGMMAVPIALGSEVTAGKPVMLFEGTFVGYDVTPDGQRFIGIRAQQLPPRTQINVAQGLLE